MNDSSVLNELSAVGSSELFEALFTQALDAVLISDSSSTYVEVNPAACALIGLPREQIVGRQVQEFFQMVSAQTVEDAWGSFLAQGALEGECWVHRPDGGTRRCDFRAKADFCPGLHMSIVRDMTERRETVQALQQSNSKLALLSGVTSELLANDRPRTLLNKLFADLSSVLGMEVYFNYLVSDGTRLHLDSWRGVPDPIAAKYEWLEFGQAVCGTVARECKARVVEDVQQSADPMTALIRDLGIQAYVCMPLIHGQQGQTRQGPDLIGTLSFGTRTRTRFHPDELQLMQSLADGVSIALQRHELISNLKSNNTELQRANQELERSNAELYHFAYAVGHDLKAPLRTVSSFAQLLTRRLPADDQEAQEFVSLINNSVSGMYKFLDSLLAYAQVSPGSSRHPRLIDSDTVLEWALMNLTSVVQESGAKITHDPLPEIRADQSQMVQVFQNLIGNALKYHAGRPPEVHVSAKRGEGETIFAAADKGVGIEPRYHESVFEIFKRLHGANFPGSGIGLALCKRIVENHGGRIWVESIPPSGSTFYFSIPD